ncbi:MAG: hypothetical protein KDD64_03570 [Bdellovibrionales bacterium]|nr:hypothetical protein [Bdellovibrionales bacterium]
MEPRHESTRPERVPTQEFEISSAPRQELSGRQELLERLRSALESAQLLRERYLGEALTDYRERVDGLADAAPQSFEAFVRTFSHHRPPLGSIQEFSRTCEGTAERFLGARVARYLRFDGQAPFENSTERVDLIPQQNSSGDQSHAMVRSGMLELLKEARPRFSCEGQCQRVLSWLAGTHSDELADAELDLVQAFYRNRTLLNQNTPRALAQGVLACAGLISEEIGHQEVDFADLAEMVAHLAVAEGRLPEEDFAEFFAALDERRPDFHVRHLRSYCARYLSEQDLDTLGIQHPPLREKLLQLSQNLQIFAHLTSREGALQLADSLAFDAGINVRISKRMRLLLQTGTPLADFEITQRTEQVLGQAFCVDYFRCIGRTQFRQDTKASQIERELLQSGNYPALLREMRQSGTSSSEVIRLIQESKASSLVELEYLCRDFAWKREHVEGFSSGLDNVADVRSALSSFAKVTRTDGSERSICLAVGYQGKREHSGTGKSHLDSQRGKDKTLRYFGTAEHPDAATSFVRDGVIHVAGTAMLEIPSGNAPETHRLLCGTPRHRSDCFLSLVLLTPEETSKGPSTIVTALFHQNSSKFRSYLVNQLEKVAANQGHFAVLSLLPDLNKQLQALGVSEISSLHFEPIERDDEEKEFGLVGMSDDDLATLDSLDYLGAEEAEEEGTYNLTAPVRSSSFSPRSFESFGFASRKGAGEDIEADIFHFSDSFGQLLRGR